MGKILINLTVSNIKPMNNKNAIIRIRVGVGKGGGGVQIRYKLINKKMGLRNNYNFIIRRKMQIYNRIYNTK